MNFGKWIFVAFLLFAIFIGTLATICLRQDVDLVSIDYYKEELAYQNQIQRINNTEQLQHKPSIKIITKNQLEVEFNQTEDIQNGELKLYCPSNSKLDKRFIFPASKKGKQLIELNGLETGMYRARLLWSMQGKDFYIEEVIHI